MENIPTVGPQSPDPLANPEEQPMNDRVDSEDLSMRNLVETRSQQNAESDLGDSNAPLKIDLGAIDSDHESPTPSGDLQQMPITGKKEKKKKKEKRPSQVHGTVVGKPKYFDQKQPHLSVQVQHQ